MILMIVLCVSMCLRWWCTQVINWLWLPDRFTLLVSSYFIPLTLAPGRLSQCHDEKCLVVKYFARERQRKLHFLLNIYTVNTYKTKQQECFRLIWKKVFESNWCSDWSPPSLVIIIVTKKNFNKNSCSNPPLPSILHLLLHSLGVNTHSV